MTEAGKRLRLGKIFRRDGRALIIAMDHAGEGGPVPGLENPRETIRKVIEGGADAIMTNFGVIREFHDLMEGRVATLLRLDGGISKFGQFGAKINQLYTVEDAVKIGADGVIVYGLLGVPCEIDSLTILAKVAEECEEWGMPLAAEVLPPSSTAENVAVAARIGSEYGADMIKTYYTGSPESFKEVTGTCPIPVLIAGGPKMATGRDIVQTVKGMLDAGGKGVFFGRNTWQYKDPTAIVRAIHMVMHEGATVDEAVKGLPE